MSVEVIEDIVAQSQVSNAWNKFQVDRTFYVANVDDSTPANTIGNVLGASGVPAMGTAHPMFPFAYVRNQQVVPLSGNQFHVICSYIWEAQSGGTGTLLKLETGVRLVQKQTSFDYLGKKLKVSYNYVGAGAATIKDKKVAVSTKMVQCGTIKAQRIIVGSPRVEAMNFVGRCNDATWLDGPQHTWMCTGITGELYFVSGSTRWYMTDYEFTYNPETWYQPVVYFNRLGKVQADTPDLTIPLTPTADSGTGLAVYQLYGESDFATSFAFLTD